METGVLSTKLYALCDWAFRLALVNLLWIFFSFAGLIVFGIMPSTIAMFTVIRKWIKGDTDVSIGKVFWSTYKQEFLKSNILGVVLFIGGALLFLDLRYFQAGNSVPALIFSYGIISLLLILFITTLYAIPTFVNFNLPIFQVFKNAFFLAVLNPLFTCLMIAAFLAMYFLMIAVPGLIPFFSGSLLAYMIMWLANQSFKRTLKIE